MKRLLPFLLILSLLISLVPAALAESVEALPDVGEKVEGFVVTERRQMPAAGAELVLFEHEATGARLLYIANNDLNRAFDLTFFTRADDNTGLPHVFEHATLDGSEKYPSDDLFFNLLYQTYNTYLNAETGQLYTTYPMSSLSEEQLLRYADFYLDSCLHPQVLEKESIFREEAWRYRLESEDAELSIEGTVYSEMLSSMNLYSAAQYNYHRVAFPGSSVGNVSGGDPEEIPNLTWDDLNAYHTRYYHPSNLMAYLYGDLEDYRAFLRLMDEAFAGYERRAFFFEEDGSLITSSVIERIAWPVEVGYETEGASVSYYALLCPGLKESPEEEMILNTLTDLLNDDSSLLMRRLDEELPYGFFGSYIDCSGPEDAIVFCGFYLNEEDDLLFRDIIDDSLREIAESGFPAEQVESLTARLSLSEKLMGEGSNLGISLITGQFAPSLAETDDPFYYLAYMDGLSQMEAWNEAGLYQQAIEKWLIGDNVVTALVTTYPEPGLREELDQQRREELAAVKASLSEADISALVAASSRALSPEEEEGESYLPLLQATDIASLPEEARHYTISDETTSCGLRFVSAAADVSGLGEIMLLLDASGLPQEDLQWYALYVSLLGELDTARHSRDELSALISRYLYGWSTSFSETTNYQDKSCHPYLSTGWISLEEDMAAGYDLVYELLFETLFTDTEKLSELISSQRSSMRNSINYGAYNLMLYRHFGASSPTLAYNSSLTGLDTYAFLQSLEALIEEEPLQVTAKLQEIQAFLKNRSGAISVFAGDETLMAENRNLSERFFSRLDERPIEAQTYLFDEPAMSEALIIDSAVQYNALIADYDTLGLPGYSADLKAVAALVLDRYLIPALREQYGVYTPMHSFTESGVYLMTYSDPNIRETFEVYASLPALLQDLEVDEETLDGYILSSYSALALSDGELSGAITAIFSHLNEEPEDLKLRYMEELKSLSAESFRDYAAAYASLVENGRIFTVGGSSAIMQAADLYEQILDPLIGES